MADLKQLMPRLIDSVYPNADSFEKELHGSRKLRIYIGIDPTAPDLHLGHSTNFLLLKKIQELGHKIILLVGDFTATIGDPSGQTGNRKHLTKEQVSANMKTYKNQVAKIIDFEGGNPAEFKFNSEWLDRLTSREIIKLASNLTIQQLIERDMFQKRISEGNPISVHEFLYPLYQGYDSVALHTDIEVGGTDQTFNMLVGRELVKRYLGKEKFVITTRLLVNPKTNRKLMSKSEGSYISLQDKPDNMYGKVMSLPDEVIFECFNLCTLLSDLEIKKIRNLKNMDAKKRLAFELVTLYHSEKEAKDSQEEFERVFQKGGQLKTKKTGFEMGGRKTIERKAIDCIMDLEMAPSRSKARRLIEQGAVKINGDKVTDSNELIKLEVGTIAQIGKLKAVEIVAGKLPKNESNS